MSFKNAIISFYINSFNFQGRAGRAEFWWASLYQILFVMVGILLSNMIELFYYIFLLVFLLSIVPSLSVTIRRFHDIDKSGFHICISLIPYLGSLITLFMLLQEGTEGKNRFGLPSKEFSTFDTHIPKVASFKATSLASLYKNTSDTKTDPNVNNQSINEAVQRKYCGHCGEKIQVNEIYCTSCGEKI